jgi:hypothetical protein
MVTIGTSSLRSSATGVRSGSHIAARETTTAVVTSETTRDVHTAMVTMLAGLRLTVTPGDGDQSRQTTLQPMRFRENAITPAGIRRGRSVRTSESLARAHSGQDPRSVSGNPDEGRPGRIPVGSPARMLTGTPAASCGTAPPARCASKSPVREESIGRPLGILP